MADINQKKIAIQKRIAIFIFIQKQSKTTFQIMRFIVLHGCNHILRARLVLPRCEAIDCI